MSAEGTGGFRVGVDIGGTFTDIVLLAADGRLLTRKVPSSADDYARAIVEGLGAVFAEAGVGPGDLAEVLHGTTVASNAILEQRGARTGLITTRGFRDVLEIRRLRMPRLYDLTWEKPPALVPRYLRAEVDERVSARGEVQRGLDLAGAEGALGRLLDEGIEALAVCLLNSYANPVHEEAIAALVRRRVPGLPLSVSAEVLPEIREYERTSTTVVNAYVMPIVSRYLATLRQGLDGLGVAAPLLLMQSNGGLMTAEAAAATPMHIIESGPAAGVVGAQALARRLGLGKLITFDMGGTTAKASIVEDGEVSRAAEYQVGGGIMHGSRLLTGAGYLLRVPAIDLAEVGAGGGSVVWIDAGGALQVGPRSAGASPGPVCYGAGGTEPTVTDANVVLGYLNPDRLAGGAVRLHAGRAREVFEARVARPLGLPLPEAALGAHLIAASSMMRAVRAVSSERGRDPREYALFAFGGNGPLFAAGMARALEMRRVVIPPAPGLFSSFGLLYAEVEHHLVRTWRRLVPTGPPGPTSPGHAIVADPAELTALWGRLEGEARARLAAEGFGADRVALTRSADCRYQGQSWELTVPVPAGPVDAAALRGLAEAFGREHERTYGHRAGPDEPVEIVSLRLVARGVDRPGAEGGSLRADGDRSGGGAWNVQVGGARPGAHGDTLGGPAPSRGLVDAPADVGRERSVYFGGEAGWLPTPILDRLDLLTPRQGPCVIEEYDATCVVPPGARAALDGHGNIVVELDGVS